MDLTGFATAQVMGFFLVFARMGAVLMFIPGFGEAMIPVRHRLALALVISAALLPAVPVSPAQPENPLDLLPVMAVEVLIGIWIGLTARIIFSALQFAGYQLGLIGGLSNAFAPSIGSFQGSTLIASALMMAGVALIFATDLHHAIIEALVMSYEVFPVGVAMPGDMAEQIVRAGARSFYIGTLITGPFFVMGLVLNAGLGLANRMMPTLPVFFVAAPVLITATFVVLVIAAPAMLRVTLENLAQWLGLMTF